MADRGLLHKSRLEEFKAWCTSHQVEIRPGKGTFQVIQVKGPKGRWGVIYEKIESPQHYSVDIATIGTVRKFLNDTRQGASQ